MDDLKLMGLRRAIECINMAKAKDRIAHQEREPPVSVDEQTAVRVGMDKCLDCAIKWIKAVIDLEET